MSKTVVLKCVECRGVMPVAIEDLENKTTPHADVMCSKCNKRTRFIGFERERM